MKKSELEVKTESPLRWPDGYPRTLIDHREDRKAWKKHVAEYQKAIAGELDKMKVTAAVLTCSDNPRDPGIALWYSLESFDDTSWQIGLNISNPVPTVDEINSAYKSLALKHHPDRGGDIEVFKKLSAHKEAALAYVLGNAAPKLESCIPMDVFISVKQNMAGLRLFLSYLRGMERLGGPAVVRRIMERTFRTALTAHATGGTDAPTAA